MSRSIYPFLHVDNLIMNLPFGINPNRHLSLPNFEQCEPVKVKILSPHDGKGF